MNHPWEIYTLSDPRTLSVRYVGVSIDAQHRLMEHLKSARHGAKNHCAHWIRALISEGVAPTLTVVERGTGKSRGAAEQQWIALYRSTCSLTNLTDGGEGTPGHKMSAEARAKLSAANLGKHATPEKLAKMRAYSPTPETRAKMSAANLGKHLTSETRTKLSAAHKGCKHSLETRAKISAVQKGRQASPETRAKMSAARLGKHPTPETRAKMGAASKGHKCSPETRAKTSATLKGRKPSPETRAKLSAAIRIWWVKRKTTDHKYLADET